MLSAFEKPGRFYKGNIHTHTDRSDGRLPPAEVCRLYREAGYDFLSLTDHFLERYGWPLTEVDDGSRGGLVLIRGAELHAPAISNGEAWHILAVGLPKDFPPTEARESGPDLARRAAAAGAFVGIAHPDWYGLTEEDGRSLAAAHAVEIYNHSSELGTLRGGGAWLADALLAAGRRVGLYAVDDAHFHEDDAFGAAVQVKAASSEPNDLVQALKAGDYYSTQGPEIHDIRIEGRRLEVRCSPVDAVFLLGLASKARSVRAPGTIQAAFELDELDSPFARLVIADRDLRLAWSNPLWRADLA